MRSRKRRRYRKHKALERYFARWRNEFRLSCPHDYHAIERWLEPWKDSITRLVCGLDETGRHFGRHDETVDHLPF